MSEESRKPRPRTGRHNRTIQSAPPQQRRAKQAWPLPGRAALGLLSVGLLSLAGVGYTTIGNNVSGLSKGGDLSLGENKDGSTDILLVGVDSRVDAQGKPLTQAETDMLHAGDEEGTNTDTLILMRIPNDGSSATAVSIPRDTYVETTDFGNTKINGVYGMTRFQEMQRIAQDSGVEISETDAVSSDADVNRKASEAARKALIDTVQNLTGVTIDHYAEVGLLGFVLVTDAVGGVEVCLNDAVNDPYSGANFKAGRQRLSGAEALSFVRQRHGLPRGDLDRIARQQAFLASMTGSMLSANVLANPTKLNELGRAAERSVVLDNDWDPIAFATQMQSLTAGDVSFETIPVTSMDGTGDYGESIVTVDKAQVQKYFKDLLPEHMRDSEAPPTSTTTTPPAVTESDYTVQVLDGSGYPGLATIVSGGLAQLGYAPGLADIVEQQPKSRVLAARSDDAGAQRVAYELGGLPVEEDPSVPAGTVKVMLAPDYNGPGINGTFTPIGQTPEPSADGTTNTPANPADVVGTQGSPVEKSDVPEKIVADQNGPRCVN
ncbi:LCP family protein [Corynebacterium ulceribovis]|uniref:LCP family protein n=1 Tax=Corynebacterium ulceribovis TaxID=487732 RepID=UPI00035F2FE2|nr:LCP family protein [Corynebacterium ulceribovis]